MGRLLKQPKADKTAWYSTRPRALSAEIGSVLDPVRPELDDHREQNGEGRTDANPGSAMQRTDSAVRARASAGTRANESVRNVATTFPVPAGNADVVGKSVSPVPVTFTRV
jgi:hypothetical protein